MSNIDKKATEKLHLGNLDFVHPDAKTKMTNHNYLYVVPHEQALGQGATSVSLAGHLPWPHMRATSDRQLIRGPLAVVANLCGICRSDDTSLSSTLTGPITTTVY